MSAPKRPWWKWQRAMHQLCKEGWSLEPETGPHCLITPIRDMTLAILVSKGRLSWTLLITDGWHPVNFSDRSIDVRKVSVRKLVSIARLCAKQQQDLRNSAIIRRVQDTMLISPSGRRGSTPKKSRQIMASFAEREGATTIRLENWSKSVPTSPTPGSQSRLRRKQKRAT